MGNYTIQQLQKVQYNINHINNITYKTQDQLEENKQKLLDQLYLAEKTDNQINEEKQEGIIKLKKSIEEIERTKINVQNQHDEVVAKLEKKKQTLRKKILTLEKLESLINSLTYTLFDKQEEFHQEVETLLRKKENIFERVDIPSFKLAIEASEIEKQINVVSNVHDETILRLKGQRNELRKEYALKVQHTDTILESLKTQYEEIYSSLQKSKHNKNHSEIAEINRRTFELNKLYEDDIILLKELQIEGWENVNEKIIEFLKTQELQFSTSGQFLTPSGNYLTEVKESCFGLLEEANVTSCQCSSKDSLITTESTNSVESTSTSKQSQIHFEDFYYLQASFGKPLTLALKEISMKQPRDPIHYLGHWLFKYRYNQEISIAKKQEIQDLINERERIEKEKTHAMIESESRAAVINMIVRAEEEAIRRELERIAKEAMSLVAEEGEYASEAEDVLGIYKGPTVKIPGNVIAKDTSEKI
ncbi:hypothetical protein RN001_001371 [Aquatica leii]|uniref:Uncharacterized protein n=1 Tax=Aquatica leii TaxID=1421715 RepID=A0AAN7PBH5_9COLE|nr:hypothetical protein RN001_001371 [Aquatica leii]